MSVSTFSRSLRLLSSSSWTVVHTVAHKHTAPLGGHKMGSAHLQVTKVMKICLGFSMFYTLPGYLSTSLTAATSVPVPVRGWGTCSGVNLGAWIMHVTSLMCSWRYLWVDVCTCQLWGADPSMQQGGKCCTLHKLPEVRRECRTPATKCLFDFILDKDIPKLKSKPW